MPDIEDLIQKAQQEGKFDDLPGKGKPLHLDENPFVNPEWQLAHHVLKNAGYSLPWIEKRKEIIQSLEIARMELTRSWDWYQSVEHTAQADVQWRQASIQFQEKMDRLNKKIFVYNLEVPSAAFQIAPLQYEHELESICNQSR